MAANLEDRREARSPQWYGYDYDMYDPQSTFEYPFMTQPRRPQFSPLFRTAPHMLTEESAEDVADERNPRVLFTTTQRTVTYYVATVTTTVRSTPTCSTLTGFSTCT